jgi:hypothetical protein
VHALSESSKIPKPKRLGGSVGCQWLMPVIVATQEAEIRRIAVRSQSGELVCETLSQKKPITKRVDGVVQGEDPEFKPQYHTHTKWETM